ncbi:MAG: PAS domain-containing sensor histidine kinase [Gammaproteobacteria bacterium]|nr:PAS domain-containing sensor histidine kinase [Gammaproteobacteria bacterium]
MGIATNQLGSHGQEHVDPSKLAYIKQQQLRMLYGNLPAALLASVLNGLIAAFVLWGEVDQGWLTTWIVVLLFILGIRTAIYAMFRRHQDNDPKHNRWVILHRVGVIVSGLVWSSLPLLFFDKVGTEGQMFIAFVMAGMCAGAATTLSYHMPSLVAFITILLAPLGFELLSMQTVTGFGMALMTVIFWLGLFTSAQRWNLNEYISFSERYDSMLRERVLEDNQVRIQTLIDSALDGIVMTDVNGAIKVFNPAAERMFGYTRDEALGANVVLLMPDNYAAQHDQYLHAHTKGRSSSMLGVARELHGRRKNGDIFPLEVNLSEMIIHGQRMFSAILRDVTQRQKLEKELRAATRMAQDANRAKSEFLSGLSHEIRTPMNAIVGFADLLHHDDRMTDDQQDYVEEIKRAGGHLIDLISDVLDLSKIEAGKIKLDMASIDVLKPVTDALSLVKHLAQARQIAVHTTLPEAGQVFAYADATRLKQVVLNLLSNAIKYNHEGGKIFVTCEYLAGDGVSIAVRDTGWGIDEEQQKKLFKPFERLGAEGTKIEGTGLGLMLSKHFVEVMEGQLSLRSKVGEGTVFTVILRSAQDSDV